ncbi:cyclin-D1-1-like [Neltuma alba]|uniref:cyclin-D1-1-like n=1 Tax=Neltuma alba TaxID=207710 RepID=UPI0010A3EBF1|nr:cyclin-D1-1-like [Prosopis alba]
MSVSPNHLVNLDLFCNEAASEVVSSDSNITNCESLAVSSVPWDSDDESCVLTLLDSEVDQVQERQQSLALLHEKAWLRTAREEAIKWMLKVQGYYSFTPGTAYLSVNYLDRFLLSHPLPKDEAWPLQLVAVACLSVAAKMEETRVPLLVDLQMIEPRFLFKPKTVQRMELLVMAALRWRLRAVTPFDFAHLFIAKAKLSCSASYHIISRVSDILIRTCLVTDFLEYPPSAIAAAALLWTTNQYVDEQNLSFFHENISGEMVQKCYNLMKQRSFRSEHFAATNLDSLPLSPTCVLDLAAMQESSKDHNP